MLWLKKLLRNRYLFVIDILLCVFSFAAITIIRYPIGKFFALFGECIKISLSAAVVYALILYIFGVYRISWLYAGTADYIRLSVALVTAALICITANFIFAHYDMLKMMFPKLNIAANVLVVGFILGIRFMIRAAHRVVHMIRSTGGKRVLIIGAGQLANALLRDITNNDKINYSVVGLIDDAKGKTGQMMYGKRILGTRDDILRICKSQQVEEIIFAIYTIDPKERAKLLEICNHAGCKIRIVPGFEENLTLDESVKKMRDVEIEDLLERDPIKLDNTLIKNKLKDKVVLVTGGGGSIGSELCRQIVKFRPKKLIILDIYENTTYEVENELLDADPSLDLEVLIASIRDRHRLNEIFGKYRPDVVFHAAAHKHVPLMEDSPSEAINNNVFGTYNVAECADHFGVKAFVMISTDKAVNPTNVMGATKRMCEMVIQSFSKRSKTNFAIVRFGNVLGSHGSVIPRFKKQIAKGGPVTVTHPEITRFFMTIPEASQLVLQAAAYAKGGEIFVLDMGKPVKIKNIAEKLILLSGYTPGVDIKIEYCGLRSGEKLYEELLMDEEGLKSTDNNKIFIGKPIDIDQELLDEKLDMLSNVSYSGDVDLIKRTLSEVVPTYKITENKDKPGMSEKFKSEFISGGSQDDNESEKAFVPAVGF